MFFLVGYKLWLVLKILMYWFKEPFTKDPYNILLFYVGWCCSVRQFVPNFTAPKMKFSIKDFISRFDRIGSCQLIWSHLLKKSLMEDFIFCADFKLDCFARYKILLGPASTAISKVSMVSNYKDYAGKGKHYFEVLLSFCLSDAERAYY